MKVLHYIPAIDKGSGGVGVYIQQLASELGKLCELHVLTHKSDDEYKLENCTIHYIPYKWKPWNNCKKEFLSLIDYIKPDVFHSNCCWMPISALAAIWANEWRKNGYKNNGRTNLKIVYSPHGMLEPYSIRRFYWTKKLPAILLYQKKGVQVCDLVHATASSEKKHLLQLGWNKNVICIPNCIQLNEIKMKASWERNKCILFMSRVHPQKGIESLIESVGRLKNDLNDYVITIAGPGDDEYIEELREYVRKCEVEDMFDFIGPVFGDEKWRLYRNADVLVLPTLSENFGIVVPEALACGTPVITTEGAPWEELNTRNCGWWVKIGTDSLVEALRKFCLCPDSDLEQKGRNGRKLVEEKYTSEVVARQFAEMYKELIER